MDTTMSIGEVAEMLGVSVPTVRRVASLLGLAVERTPGGHRRFAPDDLRALAEQLGMTPTLEGFTPHEVKVLAALARAPLGFRSLRAVARAARVSPTTAGAAVDSLADRGLVLSTAETVAEGSARDVTVYRLNPTQEWIRVAPVVSRTVPPIAADPRPPAATVPRRFWHLFWNVEPSRLRLPADERFVAHRMLLSHEPAAWAWAAQNLSPVAVASARRARDVDGPTAAMIDNLLASTA